MKWVNVIKEIVVRLSIVPPRQMPPNGHPLLPEPEEAEQQVIIFTTNQVLFCHSLVSSGERTALAKSQKWLHLLVASTRSHWNLAKTNKTYQSHRQPEVNNPARYSRMRAVSIPAREGSWQSIWRWFYV